MFQESQDETVQFTMMVMQWGQFLDHDLTSTPQTRGFNHSLIRCCTEGSQMFLNRNLLHPDCMPIRVENSDYFYSRHNATCMEFVRSSPAPRKDCSLGPRDQINQLTSYMDASNVYGSTKEDQDELRLGKSGTYLTNYLVLERSPQKRKRPTYYTTIIISCFLSCLLKIIIPIIISK